MTNVQASVNDMQDFVASIYANGKPCERFGMSWDSLSALEAEMPEVTTKQSEAKCKTA